jgi:Holliday junction resolvase
LRIRAKTDANHAEVMGAFRSMGFSVVSLHQLGGGVPDLLISRNEKTALVEVKRDRKAKLTDDQVQFKAGWRGLLYRVDCLADVEVISRGWV